MTYSKFNLIIFLFSLLLVMFGPTAHAAEEHAQHTVADNSSKIDAAKLYHDYCSVCHGDKGNGNSQARSGLNPPPRDFTSHQAAAALTRERVIRSISEGRQGTAMSGWAQRLSSEEIEALADYIRSEFMPAVTTDEDDIGRSIYAKNCSVCHGDRGQGAVWARSGLTPPPANFTDPSRTANLTRKRMIFSVTYGRPQTAMSAWGKRFSAEEIESVVDYIRTSFMRVRDEEVADTGHGDHGAAGGHDHDAHGLENLGDPLPMGLQGDAEMGGSLYEQNCVDCHGVSGDGQGPRAYFIFPKPRDFRHPAARAKYSRAHLFEVISHGVIGSEMPAWNKVLTDQQIGHISEYVFESFIKPEKPL